MTIGMVEQELMKIYNERFNSVYNRLADYRHEDIRRLMALGYSRNEATIQATAEIRLRAGTEAVLSAIFQNNKRIQTQLEQLGLDI